MNTKKSSTSSNSSLHDSEDSSTDSDDELKSVNSSKSDLKVEIVPNFEFEMATLREPSNKKSNIDLLLELDSDFFATPLEPIVINDINNSKRLSCKNNFDNNSITATHISYEEITLVDSITSNGLIIKYRFTRTVNFYCSTMISIGLTFINTNEEDIRNIQISRKDTKSGLVFQEFAAIKLLKNSSPQSATLGIDFNDSIKCANFEISSSLGELK